ncbi:MAG: family 43 glycosylhydrolase [Prevotella sp.]
MKRFGLVLCLLCSIVGLYAADKNIMMYGDSSRVGLPFAKDPCVISYHGNYFMYYSMPPANYKSGLRGWGIGIAQSSDLIHWKKVGELLPAVEYEANGICAPCVIERNDTMHIFYQVQTVTRTDAICHAYSVDGLHFIRDNSNPVFHPEPNQWTCGRAIDAEVFAYQDRYYMYFATRDPAFEHQLVGLAVTGKNSSFDRTSWTHLSTAGPVLAPTLPWETKCIEAPSAIVLDGKLYLFYAGGFNNDPQQIGIATGTDPLYMTRMSDTPFLKNGQPGEWNESESGHPDIFQDNDGQLYLFFQGNKTKGRDWLLSCKKLSYKNGKFKFIK